METCSLNSFKKPLSRLEQVLFTLGIVEERVERKYTNYF